MKNTKVYIMARDGWEDVWELHVSKTAKVMREHIKKVFLDYWGIKEIDVKDTLGMVHPVISTGKTFAYCFLNEENLREGVIAHECAHVAFAHERFVLRFSMDYGLDCNDHEERLLYYLTQCVDGCYNTLKENGHIKCSL